MSLRFKTSEGSTRTPARRSGPFGIPLARAVCQRATLSAVTDAVKLVQERPHRVPEPPGSTPGPFDRVLGKPRRQGRQVQRRRSRVRFPDANVEDGEAFVSPDLVGNESRHLPADDVAGHPRSERLVTVRGFAELREAACERLARGQEPRDNLFWPGRDRGLTRSPPGGAGVGGYSSIGG